MVKVSTLSYNQLFKKYPNISVPEYQRPYRWSVEKVEELLEDLDEFFITKPAVGLGYYIGSVLFFHNKKEGQYEIIDGQQRLTTLNLLYYCIHGELLEGQDLLYSNHISASNITRNLEHLANRSDLLNRLQALGLFNRLTFTLIVSQSEDNAFAFFDSQNNRGVSLAADDYLKAYHLRAVSSENLQEKLAQQWEDAVIQAQREENLEAGLLHLFYKILYRGREWKGQRNLIPETKGAILKSFQKKTFKSPDPNNYHLYPGRSNVKYVALQIDETDMEHLLVSEERSNSKAELPLSLRQPLFKGHNFFQFTQKYLAIHQQLFQEGSEVSEALKQTRRYYKKVYSENMSIYLRHFMQLCLIMYFDVFKDHKLSTAIQYFDYFIGKLRVDKHYVKQEAVKNSLLEATNNFLDVIAGAYIPEEIFTFIAEQKDISKVYDQEKLEKDNGVRSNYKKRVLDYYDRPDFSLKGRLKWIN